MVLHSKGGFKESDCYGLFTDGELIVRLNVMFLINNIQLTTQFKPFAGDINSKLL